MNEQQKKVIVATLGSLFVGGLAGFFFGKRYGKRVIMDPGCHVPIEIDGKNNWLGQIFIAAIITFFLRVFGVPSFSLPFMIFLVAIFSHVITRKFPHAKAINFFIMVVLIGYMASTVISASVRKTLPLTMQAWYEKGKVYDIENAHKERPAVSPEVIKEIYDNDEKVATIKVQSLQKRQKELIDTLSKNGKWTKKEQAEYDADMRQIEALIHPSAQQPKETKPTPSPTPTPLLKETQPSAVDQTKRAATEAALNEEDRRPMAIGIVQVDGDEPNMSGFLSVHLHDELVSQLSDSSVYRIVAMRTPNARTLRATATLSRQANKIVVTVKADMVFEDQMSISNGVQASSDASDDKESILAALHNATQQALHQLLN